MMSENGQWYNSNHAFVMWNKKNAQNSCLFLFKMRVKVVFTLQVWSAADISNKYCKLFL